MDVLQFRQSPPVTQVLVLAPVVLMMLASTNVINSANMAFIPQKAVSGDYWRFVTGLFYLSNSMDTFALINLVLPVYYSSVELERGYYNTTKQYVSRIVTMASLALILCWWFGLPSPAIVLYEALSYMANHRRPVGLRVVLLEIFDVSETAGLLAPIIRGLLFNENIGLCVLAGYFIGHIAVVCEDILPMWKPVMIK